MIVSPSLIQNSYSYSQYGQLLETLLSQGKTTGNDQSEAMINYAKLNLQRKQRIDKTFILNETIKPVINQITKPFTWLLITEGWCGDSAQNITLFAKIEEFNPLVSFKIALRDDNPKLMDMFLTNGSRSIPKLICLNEQMEVLFTWGPRPKLAQDLVDKAKQNGIPKDQWNLSLHSLYTQDKMQSLQNEFIELITKFMI